MTGPRLSRETIHRALGDVLKEQAARQLRIPTIGEIVELTTCGDSPVISICPKTAWAAIAERVGPGEPRAGVKAANDRAEDYALTHGVMSAVVIGDTVYVPATDQQLTIHCPEDIST